MRKLNQLLKMLTAVVCLTNRFVSLCGFKMKDLALEIAILCDPLALLKSNKPHLISKFEYLIYRFENLWVQYSAGNPIYKKLLSPKLFDNILTRRDCKSYLDPIFQALCKKRDYKNVNKILSFSQYSKQEQFKLNETSFTALMRLLCG